jgi:glyoxylase-like metal-dependent hydrolase (beta-lactamase superfamily II)
MSGELTLDVYVSDYKPIPGDPAVMSEGQATWPASSVSLLSGERDAVLIDALITFDEARKAAEWIRTKGKGLTTIYITHRHADHMFGLNTLLAVFPDARAVALAEVMPAIQSRTRGDSARPSPAPRAGCCRAGPPPRTGCHRGRNASPGGDPASLLLPARRPDPASPGEDLPGLGARWFLFQHRAEFAADCEAFLSDPG